jgi:hypothetical protein
LLPSLSAKLLRISAFFFQALPKILLAISSDFNALQVVEGRFRFFQGFWPEGASNGIFWASTEAWEGRIEVTGVRGNYHSFSKSESDFAMPRNGLGVTDKVRWLYARSRSVAIGEQEGP